MTPRVLIVSPHFPPVNAPDMQRVRMSLPHFIEAGWQVTVLTVDDPTPLAPLEPELLTTLPDAVKVVRAHCCSRRWTRWLGVNNVALRSLPFLFLAGCRALAGSRYDVVYFSTTQFIVLPFGRIWRRLYGVPYVIDLQDPWVTDFYERPGAPRPPGGWKYRVARGLGRMLEGWSMGRVGHLITVSASYAETLRSRYPNNRPFPSTELPFASPDLDLAHLRATLATRPRVLPGYGINLAFAGALGPGMLGPVDVLFAALRELREQGVPVSVHFYGTSYASAENSQPATLALATRHGLTSCVHEHPGRLPYYRALQVTLEADINLLFGSTDLAFTPSKILAVLAAGRPLLAIAYRESAMAARLARLDLPCILLSAGTASSADGPAVKATLDSLRTLIEQRPSPAFPSAAFSSASLAAAQRDILASVSGARP